jgi:hypothetical protein
VIGGGVVLGVGKEAVGWSDRWGKKDTNGGYRRWGRADSSFVC